MDVESKTDYAQILQRISHPAADSFQKPRLSGDEYDDFEDAFLNG